MSVLTQTFQNYNNINSQWHMFHCHDSTTFFLTLFYIATNTHTCQWSRYVKCVSSLWQNIDVSGNCSMCFNIIMLGSLKRLTFISIYRTCGTLTVYVFGSVYNSTSSFCKYNIKKGRSTQIGYISKGRSTKIGNIRIGV